MASLPRAASPAQQPPDPEDEDPSLDEYDLYSLAHSYLDEARAPTPPSDGDRTAENRRMGESAPGGRAQACFPPFSPPGLILPD
ncbi:nuclear protein 1 isoform X1 [Neomonachus schauinslandi]|uniref:Nuclear protein 1 isoform X1 n=1 Tax=Neomonachus schauinslandi TaxID=29088 RepID=A0A2Y9HWL3_NEOSC|nr:nuclear protein 1 isoform X1 [Neomonachus schauinslandi]